MTARDQPTAEALEASDKIQLLDWGRGGKGLQLSDTAHYDVAVALDAFANRRVAEAFKNDPLVEDIVQTERAEARRTALEGALDIVARYYSDGIDEIYHQIRARIDAPPAEEG